MNVQPVNCNNTSFNGLVKVGKVNKYYPFLRETTEEIDSFISANKEKLGEIKVMEELPFTKQDFLLYAKNRLNITKTRIIDRHMVKDDLSIPNKK